MPASVMLREGGSLAAGPPSRPEQKGLDHPGRPRTGLRPLSPQPSPGPGASCRVGRTVAPRGQVSVAWKRTRRLQRRRGPRWRRPFPRVGVRAALLRGAPLSSGLPRPRAAAPGPPERRARVWRGSFGRTLTPQTQGQGEAAPGEGGSSSGGHTRLSRCTEGSSEAETPERRGGVGTGRRGRRQGGRRREAQRGRGVRSARTGRCGAASADSPPGPRGARCAVRRAREGPRGR